MGLTERRAGPGAEQNKDRTNKGHVNTLGSKWPPALCRQRERETETETETETQRESLRESLCASVCACVALAYLRATVLPARVMSLK